MTWPLRVGWVCVLLLLRGFFGWAQLIRSKPSSPGIQLVCQSAGTDAAYNGNVEYAVMFAHSFELKCPVSYNYQGTPIERAESMCGASTQKEVCVFRLSTVFISRRGGMIDSKSLAPYSFSHPTMLESVYQTLGLTYDQWSSFFITPSNTRLFIHHNRPTYDLVVPTRMKWDDRFYHVSFQTIPFLAQVYESHQIHWERITWHASSMTAAILLLLNVPADKIVVEKELTATNLLIPWTSGWLPALSSTLFGVADNVAYILTANLLAKFENRTSSSSSNSSDSRIDLLATEEPRYVVYLPKSNGSVVNERQILSLLQQHVDNTKYELVILNQTIQYETIDEMHSAWYHYAKYIARARLVIGQHCGALSNLIFAPKDVDIIEFNEMPNERYPQRSVFLSAAWAKGVRGNYYFIDPSMKHTVESRSSKIRVSPYELLELLLKAIPEVVRNPNATNPYTPEAHGIWASGSRPDYSFVPIAPISQAGSGSAKDLTSSTSSSSLSAAITSERATYIFSPEQSFLRSQPSHGQPASRQQRAGKAKPGRMINPMMPQAHQVNDAVQPVNFNFR